ncbi:MAG: hypothetical protein WCK98_05265 [bacterium]
MILGHFKNFPKLKAFIFSGLVIFAAVLAFTYYPKTTVTQEKPKVLGVVENKSSSSQKSSSKSPNSRSTQSLNSQSSSSLNQEVLSNNTYSSSVRTFSSSSRLSSSLSSVSSSIASQRELIITGTRCNGPDENNTQFDYMCRAYDSDKEVGVIPFNFYINNTSPSAKVYIQNGNKIENKQYIYETTGGESCLCAIHVHVYDFDTKSLDYADMLSFNPLNEKDVKGESPASLIEWGNISTCSDIKLESSWLYSCFYAKDKDPTSPNQDDYTIKRTELNETEKTKIDLVKTSYFNYQKGLEKYGAPNFVTQYCAQGWAIAG